MATKPVIQVSCADLTGFSMKKYAFGTENQRKGQVAWITVTAHQCCTADPTHQRDVVHSDLVLESSNRRFIVDCDPDNL